MVPGDVALNHTQLFLTRVLGGKGRVLEVGCGGGQLAWRLAHLGLDVVGVDIALPAQRPSHPSLRFEKGDFYQFKDEPFDAVVFTSSLHHLFPLDGAVRRARNLLKPAGLIVVDEMDVLAPDEVTLRWYYEAQSLLAHAGVLPVLDHGHAHHGHPGHAPPPALHLVGKDDLDPKVRWRDEHAHHPPLHTGDAMLAALRDVGGLLEVTRGAYLFRALGALLGSGPRDLNVANWLLQTEERRIRGGSLKGTGLRAVCRV